MVVSDIESEPESQHSTHLRMFGRRDVRPSLKNASIYTLHKVNSFIIEEKINRRKLCSGWEEHEH